MVVVVLQVLAVGIIKTVVNRSPMPQERRTVRRGDIKNGQMLVSSLTGVGIEARINNFAAQAAIAVRRVAGCGDFLHVRWCRDIDYRKAVGGVGTIGIDIVATHIKIVV